MGNTWEIHVLKYMGNTLISKYMGNTLRFGRAIPASPIDLQSLSLIGQADDHISDKNFANFFLLAPLPSAGHVAVHAVFLRYKQESQLALGNEVL